MNTSKGILIAAFLLLVLPFTYIAVRGTNIIPSRAQTNTTSTPTKSPTPTITGTISPTVTLTPTPTFVCKSPAVRTQMITVCEEARQTYRSVYYGCSDGSNGYYTALNCLTKDDLRNLADSFCTVALKPVCKPVAPTIAITTMMTFTPTPTLRSQVKPTALPTREGVVDPRLNPGTGQLTCTPETLSLGAVSSGTTTLTASWKDIIPDYPAVDLCMQTDGNTPVIINTSKAATGSFTKEVQNLLAGHIYTFQLHNQRSVIQHCTGRVLSSCKVVVKQ